MNEFSLTTSNPDGYDTESVIGDFALAIDPMDETGPNPNAVLVADYASCFLPAVRMGAQQNGYDDLGEMAIEATAAVDTTTTSSRSRSRSTSRPASTIPTNWSPSARNSVTSTRRSARGWPPTSPSRTRRFKPTKGAIK